MSAPGTPQSAEIAQCIALTDRHARCTGRTQQGREFCTRHTPAPARCDGSGLCPAPLHIHGCFTDRDGSACDDPEDHVYRPGLTGGDQ